MRLQRRICLGVLAGLFVGTGLSLSLAQGPQRGPGGPGGGPQTRPAPGGGGQPFRPGAGQGPGGGGNRPGSPGGPQVQPPRPQPGGGSRPNPGGGNRPSPGGGRPPNQGGGRPPQRPPQWGRPPQNRPSYNFRPNDRDYLRRYYMRNLGYINRARRPVFSVGGFFPYAYIGFVTALPVGLYGHLPPPPPGYQMGYYDGYVVVYDPITYFIANVVDLLQ